MVVRGRYIGKVGRLPRLLKLNGSPDESFKASLHEIMPHKMTLL